MEIQKALSSQTNLENKAGGIMLPSFKLYDKAIGITIVQYRLKNRSMEH